MSKKCTHRAFCALNKWGKDDKIKEKAKEATNVGIYG